MTRQQYLEEAEEEILGLTKEEAEGKGYIVVTERPEKIATRIRLLVEIKEGVITQVLEAL